MKTLLETLQGGTAYLEGRGVGEARLSMEHLLAKVLACGRMDLYMQFDRPMAEEELEPLRALLKRRAQHEPLQHLLGEVEFCGREFLCDARALVPRPETEELVSLLLTRYQAIGRPLNAVDVGCGSGVIGLSLAAEWPDCSMRLTDLSPEALALAQENAGRLGLGEPRVRFAQGDLLESMAGEFDLVVANLPYLAASEIGELQPEVAGDPLMALDGGPDGEAIIRRLIGQLPDRLQDGGLVALEIGEGQTESLLAALGSAGLREAEAVKDLSGSERFLLALR